MPLMHMQRFNSAGRRRAATPIIYGIAFLAVAVVVAAFLPMWLAAPVLGLLVSAAFCYVVLMAMPRVTQITLMGAAMGVSADAGYAKFTDQTPITVANGLASITPTAFAATKRT